jgi:hypothetical protein
MKKTDANREANIYQFRFREIVLETRNWVNSIVLSLFPNFSYKFQYRVR